MPAIDLTSVLGAPASPAPATPAPAPAEGGDEGNIPEAVLEIPEFSGLLEGKPAAVYVDNGFKSPETDTIMQHADELANAGFGFYPGKDKKTNVVFNTQFISGEDIQKADAEGKLRDVATPFSELKASFDSIIGSGASGAAPADGAAPAPASSPALPAPAPSSVSQQLATQRVNNVAPGSPTSGPAPGQGRILNSILKRPV